MKRIILTVIVLFSVLSVSYCHGQAAISKDDAKVIAEDYVKSVFPPVELNDKNIINIVFVEKENIWIVWYGDKSQIPRPDSDGMIKIDATSGNPLGFIGGAAKQEYYEFLNTTTSK